MRHDYYRFTKVNDNTWQGYGPGNVTTFHGQDADAIDSWDKYVHKFNEKHPDLPIDRTDYFNFMIAKIW